jgi:hypothetical protein
MTSVEAKSIVKIRRIEIHNFRSIADRTITLGDYSPPIGANNSRKKRCGRCAGVLDENDLPKFRRRSQQ